MSSGTILICSLDIDEPKKEIIINAENYDSSIISKHDNILLFSLLQKEKTKEKNIKLQIDLNDESFKDFNINLDKYDKRNNFLYLQNKKYYLYSRFKAFLGYITSEQKEDFIGSYLSFLKNICSLNQVNIETKLLFSLIYHSYQTKYFIDVINFLDGIDEFSGELNSGIEELNKFFSDLLKNKEYKPEIKNKIFKLCLLYFSYADEETFIKIFLSKKYEIKNNYNIIINNKKLFSKIPNIIITKGIDLYKGKDDLITLLSLQKTFISFLLLINQYYDYIKTIFNLKSEFPLFTIYLNDEEEIINTLNRIIKKIEIENEENKVIYLEFLQKLLFENIKHNKKDVKLFFQIFMKSGNKIYIIKDLDEFYKNNLKKLEFTELILFIEKNITNCINYLSKISKSLSIHIIPYLDFGKLKEENLIQLNKVIETVSIFFPQNYIDNFNVFNNLNDLCIYLIYLIEYKKIMNENIIKKISISFFKIISNIIISLEEINDLYKITIYFENKNILQEIFINNERNLSENMAINFIVLLENKKLSDETVKIILNFFEDFIIVQLYKYNLNINRESNVISKNESISPFLIVPNILGDIIEQAPIVNRLLPSFQALGSMFGQSESKKFDLDILEKVFYFLKNSETNVIPFCIFLILYQADFSLWKENIHIIKSININKLTSFLYPFYLNSEIEKIILRVKAKIYSIYSNNDFAKLDKFNLFNIIKNADFLLFDGNIKDTLENIRKLINNDNSLLSSLKSKEINNINELMKKNDPEYNFFYFIEINNFLNNIFYLNSNLFIDYPGLLLDLSPNTINFIYDNAKEMKFNLNDNFLRKYKIKKIKQLNPKIFSKVKNLNIIDEKILFVLSKNYIQYLPKESLLYILNNLNYEDIEKPLELIELLYNNKYRDEINPLFFSKLILKRLNKKKNNISEKIMNWFIKFDIQTQYQNKEKLKDTINFDEKNFYEKIFVINELEEDPELIIQDIFDNMNYDSLKKLCVEYKDREKLIKIMKDLSKQIDKNIFGLIEKFYIYECLILIDKNEQNRIKYFNKLLKYLKKFGQKEVDGVIEYIYKIFTFNKLLEEKNFDIDLREEICEEEIKLIEGYISLHYSSYKQNNIRNEILIIYCDILQLYLDILEEKYNINREDVYYYLKSIPKEEQIPYKVHENINLKFKKEKKLYIDILMQLFIYKPDKTIEQKVKNKWINFFSLLINQIINLLGIFLAIIPLKEQKGCPSLLFGTFFGLKFSNDFFKEMDETNIFDGTDYDRKKIFINKKKQYKLPSYYEYGKKFIGKMLAIPKKPFSYFGGNLLTNNDKTIVGFGKNINDDNEINISFKNYYKNLVNSSYINILGLWDNNFNLFLENFISSIQKNINFKSIIELKNYYKMKQEFVLLITEKKIENLKKIINEENLDENDKKQLITEIKGLLKAFIETPNKMIKGFFNISDFDLDKSLDFEKEIKINQKSKKYKKIINDIKEIILEKYYNLKDINLQQLQTFLSYYKNGNSVLKRINFVIQEEYSKLNNLYEDLWNEKEKSIFGKNYFGLKKGIKLILKENEELKDWIDIDIKESVLNINENNDYRDKDKEFKEFIVIENELKEDKKHNQ